MDRVSELSGALLAIKLFPKFPPDSMHRYTIIAIVHRRAVLCPPRLLAAEVEQRPQQPGPLNHPLDLHQASLSRDAITARRHHKGQPDMFRR